MTPATAQEPWRAAFVALAVIWGSSFLCIKVLGEDWAPLHVALGRIALGALVLVALLAWRRERLPSGLATWGHLAVVGALMNAVPFTLFAYGETKVSSVLAGLWNATTPLWTLLVVLTVLREEPVDRRRLAALAGGFAGVTLLLGPWQGLEGDALLGHLACLAAAACYGLGLPYTRRHLSGLPDSGVSLAAAQLLCATAMLAVVAPLSGAPTAALPADALASLLVLGVLGSGVAYVLTHRIVRTAGPTTFSTVTYLIPVVSTALGVTVLAEPIGRHEPVGAAVVLGTMWWSSRRAPLTRPESRSPRLIGRAAPSRAAGP